MYSSSLPLNLESKTMLSINMKNSTQFILDRFAIALSMLCAVHCLAVPVLLVTFPSFMVSFHFDDHVFHELLIFLVVPSSIIAILLGCKSHNSQQVLTLACIGIVALIATALLGHDVLGETGEKSATLIAASILAFAHWKNYSLCRHNSCNH